MANQKVLLQDNGNNLYPLATLNGIDFNHMIASGVFGGTGTTKEYLAQEDCFMYITGDGRIEIYVDNIQFLGYSFNAITRLIPLKKGQLVENMWNASLDVPNNYCVYGIMR